MLVFWEGLVVLFESGTKQIDGRYYLYLHSFPYLRVSDSRDWVYLPLVR